MALRHDRDASARPSVCDASHGSLWPTSHLLRWYARSSGVRHGEMLTDEKRALAVRRGLAARVAENSFGVSRRRVSPRHP